MADNRDNIIALESAEAIDEQAATWLTTLGRDDVSDDEREKFKKWLAQSDRHRKAFHNLSAMWEDLAALKDLKDIAEAAPADNGWRTQLNRRAVMASAASLTALTIGVGYLAYSRRTPTQSGTFATAVGDQKISIWRTGLPFNSIPTAS